MARKIMNRLKFSTDHTSQVVSLVANHMKWMEVQNMKMSTLKKFLRMPLFEEHRYLHLVDCLSASRSTANVSYVDNVLTKLKEEDLRPKPLVTGRDLIEAGLTPGPMFSKLLEELMERQLDGVIETKEHGLMVAVGLMKGDWNFL